MRFSINTLDILPTGRADQSAVAAINRALRGAGGVLCRAHYFIGGGATSLNLETFMSTDSTNQPLTRADIEKLLQEVESTDKLDLSWQNMRGINLSELDLIGANLSCANLMAANLSETNLSKANLIGTNLCGANLIAVNLSEANLSEALQWHF